MKMNDHNDQLAFKLMSLNINLLDNDLSSVNITDYES